MPALVTVLPYRKDSALGLILGASALSWFAGHGYAALLVDLQGVGASDGELRPPFSAEEADDCVDAIEWAAAQPWCDGNVGMWGHSYGGLLTLRAAACAPAALKAIVPVEPLVDPWRDFLEPGGIDRVQWGAMTLLGQADAKPKPYIDYLYENREWSAVDSSAIELPALVFGGWRDVFCDATVRAFEAMRGPKQLVMGPWTHEIPNVAAVAPIDFLGMATRWFDRWLRRADNGADAEPQVRLYVQAENAWRTFPALAPDCVARVNREPGRADGSDPTIGSCGGLYGTVSALPFAPDQRDDDALSVCFDSEQLDAPITIVGRPRVDGAGDAVVRLCDVGPDGTSTLITAHGWPTAYRVAARHRLRVALSVNDFPRRARRHGTVDIDGVELRLPMVAGGGEAVDLPAAPPLPAEVLALGEWEPPTLTLDRGDISFGQRSTVGGVTTEQHTHATVDELRVTISDGAYKISAADRAGTLVRSARPLTA